MRFRARVSGFLGIFDFRNQPRVPKLPEAPRRQRPRPACRGTPGRLSICSSRYEFHHVKFFSDWVGSTNEGGFGLARFFSICPPCCYVPWGCETFDEDVTAERE